MGMTFAKYKLDKPSKYVTPAKILSTDEEMIQDLAPWSWWKCEILEPAGEPKFLEIFDDVKAMSFNICVISRSIFHISLSPLTQRVLHRPDFKWEVLCLPFTISQALEL